MAEKTLSHKDFEKLVGDDFVARSDAGEELHLKLVSVDVLGEGAEDHRDPFSLKFHEEANALVDQQTHSVEHADLGTVEIFLVPIGPDAHGMRYEAVFG